MTVNTHDRPKADNENPRNVLALTDAQLFLLHALLSMAATHFQATGADDYQNLSDRFRRPFNGVLITGNQYPPRRQPPPGQGLSLQTAIEHVDEVYHLVLMGAMGAADRYGPESVALLQQARDNFFAAKHLEQIRGPEKEQPSED